jgi:hypothetical protein
VIEFHTQLDLLCGYVRKLGHSGTDQLIMHDKVCCLFAWASNGPMINTSRAKDAEQSRLYPFSAQPTSCRQNETMGDRPICRRDAGSTLERHHEAPLNRYSLLQV